MLVASSLAGVHGHALDVAVKSDLELTKGMCLHLAGVLELANPVGLLFLEARHLHLDLNSFLVFLVNSPNEFETLVAFFQSLFLSSQFFLLLFLTPDHMFHSLSFQLVRLLLHIDHFKVLLALILKAIGLTPVAVGMVALVVVDVLPLRLSLLHVLMSALVGFVLTLSS